MAHKKGVGSSRNGRTSNPQYLGIESYGGEKVTPAISCEAEGAQLPPGQECSEGEYDTLFALVDGVVKFEWRDKDRKNIFGLSGGGAGHGLKPLLSTS